MRAQLQSISPYPRLFRRFQAVMAVTVVAVAVPSFAQSGIATPPAYNTIKEAEIKADMFAMAGDAMRGREGGTLDEMRASMWVADQFLSADKLNTCR